VKNEGAQRKADEDGEEYLLHGEFLITGYSDWFNPVGLFYHLTRWVCTILLSVFPEFAALIAFQHFECIFVLVLINHAVVQLKLQRF
jgi:hypothetical protein